MALPSSYIPIDRRQAIQNGTEIDQRLQGATLFADISGFTPLTNALLQAFGPRRGPEVLTQKLNHVYEALITPVHRYGGSVISFSGDAITCWFRERQAGLTAEGWATACAVVMQQALRRLAVTKLPSGKMVTLGMKIAIVAGPVRRFQVGDPDIQLLDILAGQTLDRLTVAEKRAKSGEIIVGPEIIEAVNGQVEIIEWRDGPDHGSERFAVIGTPAAIGQPRLVEQIVPADPLPSLQLDESLARPWLLPPVYQRLRDEQAEFLAEIRPTVALFMKFEGLTYDEDEVAGVKLDGYIRRVQNILLAHDGYLLQLTIGDKGNYVYAAFGAPLAQDDAPAQAIAAALALRTLSAQCPFIHSVQIGLSQGLARVGPYGSATRRTYGVLGDEVNIAARLMSQAEPGQIIVSHHVAEVVAERYRLKPLGPVLLRGQTQPISVSLVLERHESEGQRPSRRFHRPLVGREAELTVLETALTQSITDQGQVISLEGVAGVGKSHLAAEFIERATARGVQVVVGTCERTTRRVAYAPWRTIFRRLFALEERPAEATAAALDDWQTRQMAAVKTQLEAINPDWSIRLPLLGELLNLPLPDNETTAAFEAKLRQEARLTLAVELIEHWAAQQPLLLLIEDAHWQDEPSRHLTLALARIIADQRVLVLLVQRPQDAPLIPDLTSLDYAQHLPLAELSPADTVRLVGQRLAAPVATLVTDLIYARAQGNPFFSEELLDEMREQGKIERRVDGRWYLTTASVERLRRANCLVYQETQWALALNPPLATVDLGLPDTIHSTILARLDRLPEPHRLTLKVASVMGQRIELELLSQVHPQHPTSAELRPQFETMVGRDMVRLEEMVPQPVYSFKHNLTQEAIYETLLGTQQAQLHQAIAEALEAAHPKAVERLAYHYSHTNLRDKTIDYLDQAARKAQREYANETALTYYALALELEERWQWRKGEVEIYHLLGNREAEAEALEKLAAIPDAPVFEVAYLQGQYYEAISNYTEAQAATERALAASRASKDLAGEVRCLAQLGLVAVGQGDYDCAQKYYSKAIYLFHPGTSYSNKESQAFTLVFNGLGTIYQHRGFFNQVQNCYEHALILSRTKGDQRGEANALFGLGTTAFFHQRDFVQAEIYHQKALNLQQIIGDRIGEAKTLYNLAQVVSDAGDYSRAQEHLFAALSILQTSSNRWDEINVLNDLGILYQELGDLSKAQSYLQLALQLAQKIGAEDRQAYPMSNLGLVLMDQEKLIEAKNLLTEGLALVQVMNNKYLISFFLSYLSQVNLKAGQLERALEQAYSALELRKSLSMYLRTADDLATLSAIHFSAGNVDKALYYSEQTIVILEKCNGEGPEFPQRDFFVCYQIFASVGQTERALTALKSAYDLVIIRAKKITNPILRKSFIENVKINKEIIMRYENKNIAEIKN